MVIKETFGRFKPKKDFVMEFHICIREWKVVPRVLRNEELLELTPAVNGSFFQECVEFLGDGA